ncbi:Acyltransferase mokF [Colletotrichum shisoi]|uniref:Acyltransferase mokF n=1 Tax=Colletotrichum shisoi TaxID=2078593 RepID=A0A5Q4BAI6_9PEZI|nr:Acyltransferase mokF [Colletotrichum shisoi]
MPLSSQAVDEIRAIVENAVTSDPRKIPGTTVVVVDRTGAEQFAHSAGRRGISSNESMTLENVYWMASCTKMVVGIACMQLVEKGALRLDDSAHLEKLCPELAEIKVLDAEGKLADKKRGITLRMLLTHTAGFGYTFFNERLRDWSLPAGIDEFSGSVRDMMQPLLFQPGEGWEYGVGIDWAGIALERVTNTSLNDGTCPVTKARLLKKETVDEMFRNQIPQLPDFAKQGVQDAKPELATVIPELYPVPEGTPQGWGLTFMITGGTTGRSDGTAWWAGLPNLFWWCDRENGVAGIVCSQILPFGDPAVMGLWSQVETAVYKGLGISRKS